MTPTGGGTRPGESCDRCIRCGELRRWFHIDPSKPCESCQIDEVLDRPSSEKAADAVEGIMVFVKYIALIALLIGVRYVFVLLVLRDAP